MADHRIDKTRKIILKRFEQKLKKLEDEMKQENKEKKKILLGKKIKTMERKILEIKNNKINTPFFCNEGPKSPTKLIKKKK